MAEQPQLKCMLVAESGMGRFPITMVREYLVDGEQISEKDEMKNVFTEDIDGHWVLDVCFGGLLLESSVGSAGLISIRKNYIRQQEAGHLPSGLFGDNQDLGPRRKAAWTLRNSWLGDIKFSHYRNFSFFYSLISLGREE